MIGKKKNKKTPLGKKPFLVLSRRAIAGWAAAFFFACAWMFVIGVLVGRGTAPLDFDTTGLQKKLAAAAAAGTGSRPAAAGKAAQRAGGKTSLEFYEALKENREDVQIEKPEAARAVSKKIAPAGHKAPTGRKKAAAVQTGGDAKKAAGINTAAIPAVKKTPAAPPAAGNAAASSGASYTIQVESLKAAAAADRRVALLKKKGFAAYRVTAKIPGKGIFHRVRVGEYPSRAAARRTMARLKKRGLKPMLIKK